VVVAYYVEMGTKIIVIIRSMDDSILGMVRHTGFTETEAKKEWYLAKDQTMRFKCFVLSYHNLKGDPRTEMKKICDYLDLKYCPTMLFEGVSYNWIYDWKGSSEKTKQYRL
jgi:hypothetical protein